MTNKKAFNLGGESFLNGHYFLLENVDWKVALQYCIAVSSITNSSVFKDVEAMVIERSEAARMWKETTYPSIVELASDVYNFAGHVTTYYPPLNKAIEKLGATPSDKATQQEVEAILSVIIPKSESNVAPVTTSEGLASGFELNVENCEKDLRVVYENYLAVYMTNGTDKNDPILPTGLSSVLGEMVMAWSGLINQLNELKSFIESNVKAQSEFEADLSISDALNSWKTVAAAADKWRTNAYVSK